MKTVFLDFETYYAGDYTLSNMTTQEYVLDPRFEVIGYAIGVFDMCPQWHTDMSALPPQEWWDNAILVSHNVKFDGAILAWRYGRRPRAYVDTMAMMQCTGAAHYEGASLMAGGDFMARLGWNTPLKGDEVIKAFGKRRQDFSPEELAAYGRYCVTDTVICKALFDYFFPKIPEAELWWQDRVVKMFIDRQFIFDGVLLQQDLERVRAKKQKVLQEAMNAIGVVGDEDTLKATLMSNDKFTQILECYGGHLPLEYFADESAYQNYLKSLPGGTEFEIPTKRSAKTQKIAVAFAKTDEGMRELTESNNEAVAALASARLGVKSTIEESRLERFIALSHYNPIGIPLRVSGAHTHRLGGSDKINLQNLPSGRIKGQSTALRDAIKVPEGKIILSADSSQIECRMLNYVARQESALEIFRQKLDPYSVMASYMFNVPADEILRLNKAGDEQGKWMRATGKATVLGCGYQMGKKKFKSAALNTYGVALTEEQAELGVNTYRQTHPLVVALWNMCGDILVHMMQGGQGWFGGASGQMFYYDGDRRPWDTHEVVPGIMLPDGLWLNYYNLRQDTITVDGQEKDAFVYDRAEGKQKKKTAIYGGRLTENLIQAVSFSLLKFQARLINKRYPIRMNVHDEWWTICDEAEKMVAAQYMHDCMVTAPEWAQGLPLACEVEAGQSYGKSERVL